MRIGSCTYIEDLRTRTHIHSLMETCLQGNPCCYSNRPAQSRAATAAALSSELAAAAIQVDRNSGYRDHDGPATRVYNRNGKII